MSTYGLILAAGRGQRFGSTKQLASLEGKPLVQHVIDAFVAARVDVGVVVLGHEIERIRAGIEIPSAWRVVENPNHAEGQSTSLVAGLAAAPPGATAVAVVLGDQPRIRAVAIRALVEAHADATTPILRASYGGRPGHPVLFDRSVWADLRDARGDGGARGFLARHSEYITHIEMGGAPPGDVDTPADLASA